MFTIWKFMNIRLLFLERPYNWRNSARVHGTLVLVSSRPGQRYGRWTARRDIAELPGADRAPLPRVAATLAKGSSFGLSSRTASGVAKNDTLRPGTSILIRARSVVQVLKPFQICCCKEVAKFSKW